VGLFYSHIFSAEEEKQIKGAISGAESGTTGEIRVLLKEKTTDKDITEYARKMFFSSGMHRTRYRNAVLIVVSVKDRRVAIWGDEALHDCVGQEFWNECIQQITEGFRNKKGVEALCRVIEKCGEELKKHFPLLNQENPNELSDDVLYD
jgi:uncharacterized membrane protein